MRVATTSLLARSETAFGDGLIRVGGRAVEDVSGIPHSHSRALADGAETRAPDSAHRRGLLTTSGDDPEDPAKALALREIVESGPFIFPCHWSIRPSETADSIW